MLGLFYFQTFFFNFQHLYNNIQELWHLFKCRVMTETYQTILERLLCLAAHTCRSSHLIKYQPIRSLKPPGLIFFLFTLFTLTFYSLRRTALDVACSFRKLKQSWLFSIFLCKHCNVCHFFSGTFGLDILLPAKSKMLKHSRWRCLISKVSNQYRANLNGHFVYSAVCRLLNHGSRKDGTSRQHQ